MKQIVLIALFGALGALSRYALVNLVGGRTFPWGTLCVNVLGSALMGFLFVLIMEKAVLAPEFKPMLMTGFLGAFTTFSAFSLEAWELLDRGEPLLAISYMVGSVLLSLLALMLGIFLARTSF